MPAPITLTPTADYLTGQASWPCGHTSWADYAPTSNPIHHQYNSPGFTNIYSYLRFDTSSVSSTYTAAALFIDLTSITVNGDGESAWIGNSSHNLLNDPLGWVGIDESGYINYGGTTTFGTGFSGPSSVTYLDVQFGSVAGGDSPYLVLYVPGAPTITGTSAGQTTASETPITAFSSVTIVDPNFGATDLLTITLSGGGSLADGTGYSGLVDSGEASTRWPAPRLRSPPSWTRWSSRRSRPFPTSTTPRSPHNSRSRTSAAPGRPRRSTAPAR